MGDTMANSILLNLSIVTCHQQIYDSSLRQLAHRRPLHPMSPIIHEYLPYEVFRDILFQAALSADHHDVRQTLFHQSSWPHLRESIKFSSVCWVWRQIVTSDRVFWLNTSFTNFIHPSPSHALDCMEAVLERCSRGFNCINLDFQSLKDADNAEAIIEGALDILLKSAPEIPSSQWMKLYLSAADKEHIGIISDYFHFKASRGARTKLSSITTLGVAFIDSQRVENPSTTFYQEMKVLPRFNTQHFPNMTHLHLTDVFAVISTSNIHQCPLLSEKMMFELWLDRWTYAIEDSVFLSDQAMPPFHLVTDSYMNFVYSSFCSATALTVHFPTPSASISSDETVLSLPMSTSISNVARFFLRNDLHGLRTLQLKNVTPRIWLAFLSLLKPLPSMLLAGDPFLRPLSPLPWEEIKLYLASSLLPTVSSPHPDCATPIVVRPEEETISYSLSSMDNPNRDPPLIKEIKEKLGLPFDVEVELLKAANLGELQGLVMRCLPAIILNLPKSRIDFYSTEEEPPLDSGITRI